MNTLTYTYVKQLVAYIVCISVSEQPTGRVAIFRVSPSQWNCQPALRKSQMRVTANRRSNGPYTTHLDVSVNYHCGTQISNLSESRVVLSTPHVNTKFVQVVGYSFRTVWLCFRHVLHFCFHFPHFCDEILYRMRIWNRNSDFFIRSTRQECKMHAEI